MKALLSLAILLLIFFGCIKKNAPIENTQVKELKGNFKMTHTEFITPVLNSTDNPEEYIKACRSYYVKIASAYDTLDVRHFRRSPHPNPREILLLNFMNQYDHYIIKGLCRDSLIFLHGSLKELNNIKIILGGTLKPISKDSLKVDFSIQEFRRTKEHFSLVADRRIEGLMNRIK